jgi:hypothetical protein
MTDRKINYDAIAEFLTLGFVLGDHTFRMGEKAERIMEIPPFETNRKSTVNNVEESLKNSIEDAVKGKKNIAVHLSGGRDTRLITGLMKSLKIDFTAVTFGEKNCTDIIIAKKIAKKLNLRHKIFEITSKDFSINNINDTVKGVDGLIPFSSMHIGYQFNKKLFPENDIILAGSMMSEIMDTWDFTRIQNDPLNAMKKRWNYLDIVNDEYRHKVDEKLVNMYDNKNLEEIMFDTSIKNGFLRVIDTYTQHGINQYPIVFNKEVISNVYSLPISKRRNGYLSKKILKKISPELLNVPYGYSGYMIPLIMPYIVHQIARKIHTRGKNKYFGPCDVGCQMRYTLKDFIENNINTLELDMINHNLIKSYAQEHFSGKKYHTNCLGRVTTLKIWLMQH